MNELVEKYLDNDILRDLKKHAAQGNTACVNLLLSQVVLSLRLVLAGAASKELKSKAEMMVKDIEQMKNKH